MKRNIELHDTVEVEVSVLRSLGSPGWEETKMDMLNKAASDIHDAMAILKSETEPEDTHGLGHWRLSPEDRIRRMVIERLERAKERVEICHNDLDVEQEMRESADHD